LHFEKARYGYDANDIDGISLQCAFDRHLSILLEADTRKLPELMQEVFEDCSDNGTITPEKIAARGAPQSLKEVWARHSMKDPCAVNFRRTMMQHQHDRNGNFELERIHIKKRVANLAHLRKASTSESLAQRDSFFDHMHERMVATLSSNTRMAATLSSDSSGKKQHLQPNAASINPAYFSTNLGSGKVAALSSNTRMAATLSPDSSGKKKNLQPNAASISPAYFSTNLGSGASGTTCPKALSSLVELAKGNHLAIKEGQEKGSILTTTKESQEQAATQEVLRGTAVFGQAVQETPGKALETKIPVHSEELVVLPVPASTKQTSRMKTKTSFDSKKKRSHDKE